MSNERSYIDCHTHLFTEKRRRKLIKWARSFMPNHPVPEEATVDDVIDDLRNSGARRWVNLLYPIWPDESLELNRFGAELAQKYPEITTFGGVHLSDPEPLDVAREAIEELGMSGLKFHPMVQRFSPAEQKLMPLYPYLEEKRKALYIHTGYDEWYGWTLPPSDVLKIVENHPNMGVVLSHLCFPRISWAFDLAEQHRNVWLDTTNVWGSFAMMDQWGISSLPGVDPPRRANGAVEIKALFRERLSAIKHRVFFGTDHPAGVGGIEDIFADLEALKLDEKIIEHILQKTPEDFLDRYG